MRNPADIALALLLPPLAGGEEGCLRTTGPRPDERPKAVPEGRDGRDGGRQVASARAFTELFSASGGGLSMLRAIAVACVFALAACQPAAEGDATSATAASTQADEAPLPQIVSKDGRHALLVDGAPFLVLGGQAHNSSNYPEPLTQVWPALDDLGANT